MARPLSLRTTLVAGLTLLQACVIGGVVTTVWVRAHREAHAALREQLRFRAETLAGLLEIDREGLEFEGSARTMPEYDAPGSGAYAVIYDAAGRAVVRSPSLGAQTLAASGEWGEHACVYEELPEGPDGIPCVVATRSFLVRAEASAAEDPDWTPPDETERRYRIVVAGDSRPRDAGLARLAVFLALLGGAALAATFAGALVLAHVVLGPVRRMTAAAAALTPEDTARRLGPDSVVLELGSLAATLNSALDRLGQALDRQRRFTADASHELRTPLAVLRSNVELLLRRERTVEEYRAGLERQRRIVVRMTEITEHLLALARADDGRAPVRRTRVVLPELTRSVCDEFSAIAREDRVELACEADDSVAVDGDATYLGGMVQNLVANAVRFTPPGGSVRVELGREGGDAVLDVADTGPGIPAEDRDRVFDRFFRVRGGRDRREGAGLGLAIVDWIVRAHGGRIQVLDREGGGALFRVRLPLAN